MAGATLRQALPVCMDARPMPPVWGGGSFHPLLNILFDIMFYHARTEAFFTSDGEIIGRKIIHSDEAAPAIWIDAAHFAHAIAVRAFNIDQHLSNPFLLIPVTPVGSGWCTGVP